MAENYQKKVLVIEDEDPLLKVIQKKLLGSGFEAIAKRDAESAIEYLNSEAKLPNLIWLDYYLPGIDGLEFLKEIKKVSRLQRIPVFVISNTASQEKVSAMMKLGVVRYYVKPEKRLEEIIREISEFLNQGG